MSIGKLYIDGKEAGEIANTKITVTRDVERNNAYISFKSEKRSEKRRDKTSDKTSDKR
ncbi:MAG: hypothetical protein IKW37_01330 [Bacteroidaceae bacterium]|nr:hypothetical protein [Bacteroidaceae bacterium]